MRWVANANWGDGQKVKKGGCEWMADVGQTRYSKAVPPKILEQQVGDFWGTFQE